MPIFKSVLTKIIIEKNKNIKFNTKKAYCHLSRNIILHSAIKDMGIVKKKRCYVFRTDFVTKKKFI